MMMGKFKIPSTISLAATKNPWPS
jgi:hypothetical protein